MLVYTITINVEASHSAEWLVWMKENFLLPVMTTGLFERYNSFRVLHDHDDGDTFTFQFFCDDVSKLHQFQEEHKGAILHTLMHAFPDKVVYFNTVLEELE